MAKKAKSPINWHQFQSIMRDFGFEYLVQEKDKSGVIFRAIEGHEIGGRLKSPVTIAPPSYLANDGETLAYERDYVVDLLTQMIGNGSEDAILTIIAKRRLDS